MSENSQDKIFVRYAQSLPFKASEPNKLGNPQTPSILTNKGLYQRSKNSKTWPAWFPFTEKDYYYAKNRNIPVVLLKDGKTTTPTQKADEQVKRILGQDAVNKGTRTLSEIEQEDTDLFSSQYEKEISSRGPGELSKVIYDIWGKTAGSILNPQTYLGITNLIYQLDPQRANYIGLDNYLNNVKKVGSSFLNSFNPFTPGISPSEKIVRFLNLVTLLVGSGGAKVAGTKSATMLKEVESIVPKLADELNINPQEISDLVSVVKNNKLNQQQIRSLVNTRIKGAFNFGRKPGKSKIPGVAQATVSNNFISAIQSKLNSLIFSIKTTQPTGAMALVSKLKNSTTNVQKALDTMSLDELQKIMNFGDSSVPFTSLNALEQSFIKNNGPLSLIVTFFNRNKKGLINIADIKKSILDDSFIAEMYAQKKIIDEGVNPLEQISSSTVGSSAAIKLLESQLQAMKPKPLSEFIHELDGYYNLSKNPIARRKFVLLKKSALNQSDISFLDQIDMVVKYNNGKISVGYNAKKLDRLAFSQKGTAAKIALKSALIFKMTLFAGLAWYLFRIFQSAKSGNVGPGGKTFNPPINPRPTTEPDFSRDQDFSWNKKTGPEKVEIPKEKSLGLQGDIWNNGYAPVEVNVSPELKGSVQKGLQKAKSVADTVEKQSSMGDDNISDKAIREEMGGG